LIVRTKTRHGLSAHTLHTLTECRKFRSPLRTALSSGAHDSINCRELSWRRMSRPGSMSAQVARDCRALVDTVRVAPEIRDYIARLTRATREDPAVMLGASPRASVALQRAARAGAVLEGRDYVVPDDVKARATSVLRHRIVLAPELEVEGRSADEVLAAVIMRTAAPT